MTILFLCTGNTCRSPMAAALFARLAADMTVRSAGLSAWPGAPAEPNAVAAAAELGADCAGHSACQATPALLEQADLVVCLAAGHARHIAPFVPPEKIRVLGGGVADPYGGDLARYRACAAQISAALPSLLPELRSPAAILPTEESHLPALAALEREAFSPPASEAKLREKLANPNCKMLTALVGSEVAGFVGVDEIAGEAFVDDLAVFPAYRRQGIASALLARAETGAILRGCEKIHIEAREGNTPARKLYETRGYAVVGRRKNYYQSPAEDAILMTMEVN